MRNRIAALGAAAALVLILTGCAATGPQQEEAAAPAVQEEVRQETVVHHKGGHSQPCERGVSEVVQKARETMHSVKKDCHGVKIHAFPMWDMNYDGTVHVIVSDKDGKVILDEYRKP